MMLDAEVPTCDGALLEDSVDAPVLPCLDDDDAKEPAKPLTVPFGILMMFVNCVRVMRCEFKPFPGCLRTEPPALAEHMVMGRKEVSALAARSP